MLEGLFNETDTSTNIYTRISIVFHNSYEKDMIAEVVQHIFCVM